MIPQSDTVKPEVNVLREAVKENAFVVGYYAWARAQDEFAAWWSELCEIYPNEDPPEAWPTLAKPAWSDVVLYGKKAKPAPRRHMDDCECTACVEARMATAQAEAWLIPW